MMLDIGKSDDENMSIYTTKHGFIDFNVKKGEKNLSTEVDIRQAKVIIDCLSIMVREYEQDKNYKG